MPSLKQRCETLKAELLEGANKYAKYATAQDLARLCSILSDLMEIVEFRELKQPKPNELTAQRIRDRIAEAGCWSKDFVLQVLNEELGVEANNRPVNTGPFLNGDFVTRQVFGEDRIEIVLLDKSIVEFQENLWGDRRFPNLVVTSLRKPGSFKKCFEYTGDHL